MAMIQHVPFASQVDIGLWSNIASKKLHSMRLSSEPVGIWGAYGPPPRTRNNADRDPSSLTTQATTARFCVEARSLDQDADVPLGCAMARGSVTVVNTKEEFKDLNKAEFLERAGARIIEAIDSGEAISDPSLLSYWSMVVYSDLKTYSHFYWLAFPALPLPSPAMYATEPQPLSSKLTREQIMQLHAGYAGLCEGHGNKAMCGYFLVCISNHSGVLEIKPLESYEKEGLASRGDVACSFGFLDPSSLLNNPGWPLRNLLFLVHRKWSLSNVSVIAYRELPNETSLHGYDPVSSLSAYFEVSLAAAADGAAEAPRATVGWEQNARGKMGPRKVDLAPFLDPAKRAVESADLNLNLMKWRFLPDLDTDRLAGLHCVLLGSGTLGCNVARSLLSWGVRNISFLDYGKVSFSNPTRQWLFEFEDCVDPDQPSEGRLKAKTAAERLAKIVPNVKSRGYHVPIPMPGHPVGSESEAKVKGEVAELEALIDSADVVFLLTDSRESRWLPTLMCVAKGKPCINVALGFDTFVVMRHGVQDPSKAGGCGCNVGCYFCNDVVAPTDSSKNRTLDQQCTTTRPGLSAIASALAVELTVSLVHHPKGPLAPPDLAGQVGDDTESMLGLVPHQIRGFLTNFSNVLIHGKAFDGCTACGPSVISAYKEGGWSFLMRCFNEPDYLETLSGLKALKDASDAAMGDWDDVEDEEGDDF